MGLSSRLLLAVLSAAAAQAHFALLQPPSALSTENGGKGAPPCGEGNESRIVTSAQGGHAIAIRLTEFVFHPGHYRFALSVNSRSELPPDPGVVEDGDGISISAAIQNPATAPILADGVFLHSTPPNGDWQMELTLPNLNCEKCTLQISEFMAEHGAPFFYHHCADLKITADPSLPPADASWPKAAVPSNSVFPHVATGGGWSTVLALINTSGLAVAATIAFRGDEGSDLGLLVTTTQDGGATNLFSPLKVTVNPDSTLLISPAGQLAATVKGWADVRSSGALGGYALMRSNSAALEVASALQTPGQGTMAFPYDNTAGFTTTIVIVNTGADAANITASLAADKGNAIGSRTIAIAPGGRAEIDLAARIPASAGKLGVVRLQGPAGIAAMALRTSAAGALLVLPPL